MHKFYKEFDFEEKINPFLSGVIISVSERTKGKDKILLEDERYTKVFQTPSKRLLVCGLSNAAKNLFIWIQYSLVQGEDIIQIDRERCCKELRIESSATFYKGISDLTDKAIICKVNKSKCAYWINPTIFFSGSRPNKYPHNLQITRL